MQRMGLQPAATVAALLVLGWSIAGTASADGGIGLVDVDGYRPVLARPCGANEGGPGSDCDGDELHGVSGLAIHGEHLLRVMEGLRKGGPYLLRAPRANPQRWREIPPDFGVAAAPMWR